MDIFSRTRQKTRTPAASWRYALATTTALLVLMTRAAAQAPSCETTDHRAIRFRSDPTHVSTYRLYGSHLCPTPVDRHRGATPATHHPADRSSPKSRALPSGPPSRPPQTHGLLLYLHGDGAGEFDDPDDATLTSFARIARKHHMLMVAPRTPDTQTMTWWRKPGSTHYLRALLLHLYAHYPIDRHHVWLVGYSGGAEEITYNLLMDHNDLLHGGGALLVGGGGLSRTTVFGHIPSHPLRQHFPLYWLAGEMDTPDRGGDDKGFDALGEAHVAERRLHAAGFLTHFRIIPDTGHYHIILHAPSMMDRLLTQPAGSNNLN